MGDAETTEDFFPISIVTAALLPMLLATGYDEIPTAEFQAKSASYVLPDRATRGPLP